MKNLSSIAAAIMLASCATSASVDTGKAIAASWATLDGAALAADTAVKAGKLHGQSAATVASDLRRARDALTVATNVYTGAVVAGTNPMAEVIVATTALAEISTLIQGAK